MNQNSIIEIGSKANVILRFKGTTCVNGKTYQPNEPYLFLKDVNVLINYSNQDKVSSTDINVLANSDIKPRTVTIGGVNFTRKLAALLATFEAGGVDYNPTLFRTLEAEKEDEDSVGTVYLVDDIVFNEKTFVYDSNFEKIESQYNSDLNALTSESFQDGEMYLISFSSVKIGTKFDMNKPHVPYMSLEIQGIGNIDKVAKNVLMYFDKVSLNSILEFTFIQGDMINVPLEFHIIDDKKNYVVFED